MLHSKAIFSITITKVMQTPACRYTIRAMVRSIIHPALGSIGPPFMSGSLILAFITLVKRWKHNIQELFSVSGWIMMNIFIQKFAVCPVFLQTVSFGKSLTYYWYVQRFNIYCSYYQQELNSSMFGHLVINHGGEYCNFHRQQKFQCSVLNVSIQIVFSHSLQGIWLISNNWGLTYYFSNATANIW